MWPHSRNSVPGFTGFLLFRSFVIFVFVTDLTCALSPSSSFLIFPRPPCPGAMPQRFLSPDHLVLHEREKLKFKLWDVKTCLNLDIIQVLKIVACSDTIHFDRIRPENSGSASQIGMSRMTHSWLNQSSKIKCSKPINRRVRPGTWNSTQRCIRLALTCVCVTVRLDFVTYLYNIGKYSSEPEQDDYPFSSLFLVHVLLLNESNVCVCFFCWINPIVKQRVPTDQGGNGNGTRLAGSPACLQIKSRGGHSCSKL